MMKMMQQMKKIGLVVVRQVQMMCKQNKNSVSLSNGLGLSLSNRRPPLSLKSNSASLHFPQILYVRDLGLSMFLCFDLG